MPRDGTRLVWRGRSGPSQALPAESRLARLHLLYGPAVGVVYEPVQSRELSTVAEFAQQPPAPLTASQQRIHQLLYDSTRDQRFQLSYRELTRGLSMRSPNTIHRHLRAIEKKGCIRFERLDQLIESPFLGSRPS